MLKSRRNIRQMENFNKEMEHIKNSQTEILEIEEIVVTQLKNSFNGLIRQLVITEERINELEDKPTEIIQTETQSKNRVRKKPKQ